MSLIMGMFNLVDSRGEGTICLAPFLQYVRREGDEIVDLDVPQTEHFFRRAAAKRSGSSNLLHMRKRCSEVLSVESFSTDTYASLREWFRNRKVPEPITVVTCAAGATQWYRDASRGFRSVVVQGNKAYSLYCDASWRYCRMGCYEAVNYWDKAVPTYSYYSGSHDFTLNPREERSPTALIDELGGLMDQYMVRYEKRASSYVPGSAFEANVQPRDTRRIKIADFSWAKAQQVAFESYEAIGAVYAQPAISIGFATAYQNAVRNLPEAKANAIANLMQVSAELASLLRKHKVSRPSVREEWLKYRYVHNTTRADLEEYSALARRICDLATMASAEVTVHGSAQIDRVTYKASAKFSTASLLPDKVTKALDQFNIRLSLYNMWDLVPYSFVVDWFLPIGDLLDLLDNYARSLRYTPSEVWYTAYQTYEEPGVWMDSYLRLRGKGQNRNLPALQSKRVSGVTLIQRIADTGALFFESM